MIGMGVALGWFAAIAQREATPPSESEVLDQVANVFGFEPDVVDDTAGGLGRAALEWYLRDEHKEMDVRGWAVRVSPSRERKQSGELLLATEPLMTVADSAGGRLEVGMYARPRTVLARLGHWLW